ncbi:MAG: GGDEF domain-containing protein [Ilumatobacteraceae bacterium]
MSLQNRNGGGAIRRRNRCGDQKTLTRLPNRWALTERVDAMLSAGQPFALLILDLDRFKEVNDTLGHEAGDHLLEVIAQRLAAVTGDVELLARFGNDEFAIIVDGADADVDVLDLLRNLSLEASRPLTVGGVQIAVSISSGVALSRNGDGTRGHPDAPCRHRHVRSEAQPRQPPVLRRQPRTVLHHATVAVRCAAECDRVRWRSTSSRSTTSSPGGSSARKGSRDGSTASSGC